MIAFTLTMPNVGSWNGKWTGEKDLYCKTMKLQKAKETELNGKNFYHNFGDGWGANINAKKITAAEAKSLSKKSRGFCGYDWMIDSIINHGKILTSEQIKKLQTNEVGNE